MYRVKEAFYTLQGEGAQAGRAAVFCRFSKCNLWNGRERDRARAVCSFCDTDFVGTDGQNGGVFETAEALADHLWRLWPSAPGRPYVVCTGGEPLLQLDDALVAALHRRGFEVGVETNGTLPPPGGHRLAVCQPQSRRAGGRRPLRRAQTGVSSTPGDARAFRAYPGPPLLPVPHGVTRRAGLRRRYGQACQYP